MKSLIFKYCRGKASDEEIIALYKWINLSDDNRKKYIEIKNFCVERDVFKFKFLGSRVVEKGRILLYEKLGWFSIGKKQLVLNGIMAFNVASIALFVTLFSIYFYNYQVHQTRKIADLYLDEIIVNRVERRALLKLATGETVELGSSKDIKSGNIKVNDKGSSAIIQSDTSFANLSNVNYNLNIISTDSGGDYEVILPDGSSVLLNSKSSISFPDRFSRDQRVVILSGEAIFNIKHNESSPFIVVCEEFSTKVLGTEFVVTSYSDELISKVSLISGSVEFLSKDSLLSKVINPNYQVTYSQQKGVYRYEIFDSYKYQALKDGYFFFSQSSIREVIKELERWYDIKINLLTDNYDNLRFNGKISKDNSLLTIINQLNTLYDFKYYIKNEQLMIK